jgi:hypothetical protein
VEQLKLKIAVGGEEASPQQPDNDIASKTPRRAPKVTSESVQLKFRLFVLQPTRLPLVESRPASIEECEERHTWLPYCPHVSCQYHLLLDIVDSQGTLRTPFVSSDDEFDIDSIPRVEETFNVELLEPEDRPQGTKPGDMVKARVPATCALRIAQALEREHETGAQLVEYATIGEFLKLSKERVRQIANDAYEKVRRSRETLIGEGQTIDELFDT